MIRNLHHIFLLFALFLLMVFGCTSESQTRGDAPLEESISIDPALADQIFGSLKMALLKRKKEKRVYMMRTEDVAFEQIHYVQNVWEGGQNHFREIYNIYRDSSMGQLEVYVSEFHFHPDSLNRLYRQEDYRVVLKGDSAFVQEETFSYINPWRKKQVTVAGKSYEIFQIEGYSPMHLQTELPKRDQPSDYLKFWNPEIGTILVFYGEGDDDQMFELQQAGFWEQEDLAAELRQQVVKAFRN